MTAATILIGAGSSVTLPIAADIAGVGTKANKESRYALQLSSAQGSRIKGYTNGGVLYDRATT